MGYEYEPFYQNLRNFDKIYNYVPSENILRSILDNGCSINKKLGDRFYRRVWWGLRNIGDLTRGSHFFFYFPAFRIIHLEECLKEPSKAILIASIYYNLNVTFLRKFYPDIINECRRIIVNSNLPPGAGEGLLEFICNDKSLGNVFIFIWMVVEGKTEIRKHRIHTIYDPHEYHRAGLIIFRHKSQNSNKIEVMYKSPLLLTKFINETDSLGYVLEKIAYLLKEKIESKILEEAARFSELSGVRTSNPWQKVILLLWYLLEFKPNLNKLIRTLQRDYRKIHDIFQRKISVNEIYFLINFLIKHRILSFKSIRHIEDYKILDKDFINEVFGCSSYIFNKKFKKQEDLIKVIEGLFG